MKIGQIILVKVIKTNTIYPIVLDSQNCVGFYKEALERGLVLIVCYYHIIYLFI